MPRLSSSSRRSVVGNNRNSNKDLRQPTDFEAAVAAARPPIPPNLTSTSYTGPALIDRLSEVPVRNVLRYLDEYRDYLALTALSRNFNSIGRTPGAALEYAVNKVYRVGRGCRRRSDYDVWISFLWDEFELLFKSLAIRKSVGSRQLEGTQTPAAVPPGGHPFQGVYGTLDAMRYRLYGTQGTAPVANFPDWPQILDYQLPDKVEFGSPEFRLQVMQLAARVHGERCCAALYTDPNGRGVRGQLQKAPRWAPDYPLLAYVLNGGDIVPQEDVKISSFERKCDRTVLSIAILRAFPRVVKILLEHRKVDVTARQNQALACACSMGHMEIAKALVARGADLNDVGGGGHGYALPISFAAAMRDTALLDEFLALGAIPNIPGREGEPLFLAVGATVLRDLDGFHSLMRGGDGSGDGFEIPIAAALMKRRFVLGPLRDATLLLAAYAEGAHVMVELFRHRPMQKDQDAIDTALCIASLTLNQEAVHFLATLGADMNCRKAIHGGQSRSPLNWAMLASSLPDRRDLPRLLETIDLLVLFGADANDSAILDEFLVTPVTTLFEPLPAYPTTAEPGVDVEGDDETDGDDDDDDDDIPLVKRPLTPEEKAYDEKEFKDDDAPWGTLFRALLVRGMDPYAWPEKRYFDHLKEWSPSTVKLFRDKRWKKRHVEKQVISKTAKAGGETRSNLPADQQVLLKHLIWLMMPPVRQHLAHAEKHGFLFCKPSGEVFIYASKWTSYLSRIVEDHTGFAVRPTGLHHAFTSFTMQTSTNEDHLRLHESVGRAMYHGPRIQQSVYEDTSSLERKRRGVDFATIAFKAVMGFNSRSESSSIVALCPPVGAIARIRDGAGAAIWAKVLRVNSGTEVLVMILRRTSPSSNTFTPDASRVLRKHISTEIDWPIEYETRGSDYVVRADAATIYGVDQGLGYNMYVEFTAYSRSNIAPLNREVFYLGSALSPLPDSAFC
ncbi:hypothetical protein HDU87_002197 [Geranomyces variabilis]|uniref:Ankyrin repeat protein n=1 Tax=Geranomyces variabilis TaxID=109894 RepID=A0AAD5TP17_9FUNG|nr:hypothetical protein HDU87_002197 [Geranomyces variabilis]